jgi:hypothetical protein
MFLYDIQCDPYTRQQAFQNHPEKKKVFFNTFECKTWKVPNLMHQMRISTIYVSFSDFQAEKH